MAKLLFGAVHLDHPVDRLGGQGLAYANTTFFRTSSPGQPGGGPRPQNYTIELDTVTALVTVTAENGGAIVVPRERVMRFEPLPPAPAPSATAEETAKPAKMSK
jgi:hypothetical protein